MIFGGGAFEDVFGDLSFITMASDEFQQKAAGVQSEEELDKFVQEAQEKRVAALADALRTRLDDYLSGTDKGITRIKITNTCKTTTHLPFLSL